MRKYRVIGLALAVVFAFCAFSASAMAVTIEWLINGSPVATAQPATTTGLLTLTTLVFNINVATVDCEGTLDGTVGPGATDEITALLNKAGEEISKTPLSGLFLECLGVSGLCPAGGPAEVYPLNLPWLTELELMAEAGLEWLDHLYREGAQPGYEVMCYKDAARTELTAENSCTGLSSGVVANVAGGVEATYGEAQKSEDPTCTEGTGMLSGTGLISSSSGTLTVSEE